LVVELLQGQHSSGEPILSFQYSVLASVGNDIRKNEFFFRYYGKLVDMGVGEKQSQAVDQNGFAVKCTHVV